MTKIFRGHFAVANVKLKVQSFVESSIAIEDGTAESYRELHILGFCNCTPTMRLFCLGLSKQGDGIGRICDMHGYD
jgi:hypothetical protein